MNHHKCILNNSLEDIDVSYIIDSIIMLDFETIQINVNFYHLSSLKCAATVKGFRGWTSTIICVLKQ